jgi:hypothetical protein
MLLLLVEGFGLNLNNVSFVKVALKWLEWSAKYFLDKNFCVHASNAKRRDAHFVEYERVNSTEHCLVSLIVWNLTGRIQ